MMRLVRRIGGLVVLVAAGGLTATLVQAQVATRAIDEADRASVVETAARLLRNTYVFPDVGDQAATAIETALRDGAYAGLVDNGAFARRLTTDLQAVTKDRHLRVVLPPPPPGVAGTAPSAGAAGPPPAEGGVTRADILDGNVGYLEVVAFPPPVVFAGATDRAMAALRDTRALIVDLRRNGGGSAWSVTHLVSYFLDGAQPVHVNTFITRNADTDTFRSQEFWSTPTSFSYAGKPVFVLTSGRTFSGGEEFAYDMQVMDLAEIVGETTGGGANPGGVVPLAAGMSMFVPTGRAENPITGTNWEGVGVSPDLEVGQDKALAAALERLGVETPAGGDIASLSRSRVFEPVIRTTPQSGTEAAIRRLSAEAARGELNLDQFTPDVAELARNQLQELTERFSSLGPVRAVTFVRVVRGLDVYDVEYANGQLRWMAALAPDGKVSATFSVPPPQ